MTRFAGLSLVLLFLVSPIFAQTTLLRGSVTDQSGAIVPGAKVALTGPDGSVKTALTDDKGFLYFRGIVASPIYCDRIGAGSCDVAASQDIAPARRADIESSARSAIHG